VKESSVSRRKFLKATGAIGAAGALAGCLPKRKDHTALALEKPPVPGSDKWYLGEEKMLASSCGQCAVNCGIQVRVVEGRAVKINGNPQSLLVGGKLGPKGQTGLYTVYDPDRIQTPLKRVGNRGAGQWQSISWEQGLKEVANKLSTLRTDGQAHRLSVFCGVPRGFMKDLFSRFCQSYGTPNFFHSLSAGDAALAMSMHAAMGINDIPSYDADNTNYILSLGSGLFESTCNGVHFARSTGKFRRNHPTRRSKIVQVEPARTPSGQAADEWLTIRPGTYDVLALGIAHQLVKANLHDKAFIEAQTSGFDRFAAALENYPIEKVAEITGMRAKDIFRLAWELAESKPSIVVVDARSTATSNGRNIARCALALNAILGSIERPGGIVARKDLPLQDWAAVTPDLIAEVGLKQPTMDGRDKGRFPLSEATLDGFPEAVLAEGAQTPEALFLYYSNPLYSKNNPDRFRKAFDKIPFIVSFSPFLDESSFFSDLILPDHTYLERWEDATPPPFGFQTGIGIRRPVVEPLYQTKHTGDALIQIAKGLSGSVAEAFPWESFKEAMEERLKSLATLQRGSFTEEDPDDFLRKLYKVGCWFDDAVAPESWKQAFQTPSGKFEFYSRSIENQIQQAATRNQQSVEATLQSLQQKDLESLCLPLPSIPVFNGSQDQFPLVFMPYQAMGYAIGSGANIPFLKELVGLQHGLFATESWRTWVEIHPETAQNLGIAHGDRVWVESSVSHLPAFAMVTAAIPKQVAMMQLGAGHTQFGRFAKDKGANPLHLLAADVDPINGFSSRCATRVRIKKA
jgi:menaquinone reductase, molybdopterin-binding-like subunit